MFINNHEHVNTDINKTFSITCGQCKPVAWYLKPFQYIHPSRFRNVHNKVLIIFKRIQRKFLAFEKREVFIVNTLSRDTFLHSNTFTKCLLFIELVINDWVVYIKCILTDIFTWATELTLRKCKEFWMFMLRNRNG